MFPITVFDKFGCLLSSPQSCHTYLLTCLSVQRYVKYFTLTNKIFKVLQRTLNLLKLLMNFGTNVQNYF